MSASEQRPFRVIANSPLALEMFSLTLTPDDGKPMFSFVPGQWVGVRISHDPVPHRRAVAFSIASAPVESTHTIELAVKVYGSFSRLMQTLGADDHVTIQGPFGVFTLNEWSTSSPKESALQSQNGLLVFFAGGIGITPLRSMIREVLLTQTPRDILLFYSNRSPASIAYEEELRQLATSHSNFHVVFLLTGERSENWDGENGRLDAAMFDRHVPDVANAECYMCGPRPFMDAITSLLVAKGVDVKTKLRKELFG
ncbi:MAG: FAD-dependent oxidoreductase [Patescibacteria group bacterium]